MGEKHCLVYVLREIGCKSRILDLHFGHVGSEVQKNILLVLLWVPANVGEKHCLVNPEKLVASLIWLVRGAKF